MLKFRYFTYIAGLEEIIYYNKTIKEVYNILDLENLQGDTD
ncbi:MULTISPECIES: hypothetical protein [unclassified Campylobacter]|nr:MULTISPECIES: hypothetical protein [unclassified Campylobacter]